MIARALLLASLLACGAPAPTLPDAPAGETELRAGRTNVLWLTLCTLRADHLGAYGYAWPTSPNLDALAARGVRFAQVVTPAPWTRPGIAAQLTSSYPATLDIDRPQEGRNLRRIGDVFTTAAELFRDAGYRTIGITANPNTNKVFGFDQGFEVWRDTGNLTWATGYRAHKIHGDEVSDRFLEILDGDDRPFFAHLVYVDVHDPYPTTAGLPRWGLPFVGSATPRYDRLLADLDAEVARLLRALAERGHDDLLVVVTSDHGEGLAGDEPRLWHGQHPYNAHTFVPWILQHPALEQGVTVPMRVETIDVLPTVASLLGLDLTGKGFEGRSVVAAWRGGQVQPRPLHVVETAFDNVVHAAAFDDAWKLVVHQTDPPMRELYRWQEDVAERQDVAAAHPEVVASLEGKLAAWRQAHPPRVDGAADQAPADPTLDAQLEALGYAEPDDAPADP